MARTKSDPNLLRVLIPHIFLPPQLPQASLEDTQENAAHILLCDLLIESAAVFQDSLPNEERAVWGTLTRMISKIKKTLQAPLSTESLEMMLGDMGDKDLLALHVHAQNAAVIIRLESESATFDIFEVSLPNQDVMASENRLLCAFPAHSVVIPIQVFGNSSFQRHLSTFLSAMDVDELDAAPTTIKANSVVKEVRDTTDPRYITELLVGILHGIHGAQPGTVHRITKRIADDVLWHNTYKPWRRSPLYLILRVAIQLSLPAADYKSFMALFMAQVLTISASMSPSFSSDILQVMRAKVARRVAKLGSFTRDFVARLVHSAVQKTGNVLSARWQEVQLAQSRQALWDPRPLSDQQRSTNLVLASSKSYLRSVLNRKASDIYDGFTVPPLPPRLHHITDFSRYGGSRLLASTENKNSIIALCDFEQSVFDYLDDWVDAQIAQYLTREHACSVLFDCFNQYNSAADAHYSRSNPLEQSFKLITMLAIWAGIDRLAVADHLLLADYPPDLPLTLLEPLLLRDEKSIRIAANIERYIQSRYSRATQDLSIFSDSVTSSSFAVQHFSRSIELQNLKACIEERAEAERKEKRSELCRLNDLYANLTAQVSRLSHDYITQTRAGYSWEEEEEVEETVHSKSCYRCTLERQASNLSISVHEWPLPSSEYAAMHVVFELACPSSISIWREVTYGLVFGIGLGGQTTSANPPAALNSYSGLRPFYSARSSRIGLSSSTKPFVQSHYGSTRIPAAESPVLVNNGLKYRLFDSISGAWVVQPLTAASFVQYCTLKLPSSSKYAHLQHTISSTLHAPNTILASQSTCPRELSLHEHISFGSLRSGGRLQWMNIARELRAQTLSFNTVEVSMLLCQAMWQIGPLHADGHHREWHSDLQDANFCTTLLRECYALIQSVGENWEQGLVIRTTVLLLLRVIEAATENLLLQEAYKTLRLARAVAMTLIDKLMKKLSTHEASSRLDIQKRICDLAAVACSTFDVSDRHLDIILVSRTDLYELLRCVILTQENLSSHSTSLSGDAQHFLSRHLRLLHRIETRLRDHPERNAGLDDAVASLWSAFSPGCSWEAASSPSERLLICKYLLLGSASHRTVSFNLLDGCLLIDGKPLGRLPQEVTAHSTYTRIFQENILEVIPASHPGMEYEARSSISSYTVFFALVRTKRSIELVIRAHIGLGEELELIPHEKFRDDLPTHFIDNFVHWMNLQTGEIEFRPLGAPWKSDPQNWHLDFPAVSPHSTLRKGTSNVLLVDMSSSVFKSVYACLGVLEHQQFVHVTNDRGSISVDLPRLKLSFFVNDDQQLESTHRRGMIVDNDQSAGTLFGLMNQLVLRAKGNATALELPRSRCVLIPEGTPCFTPDPRSETGHIQVTIDVPLTSHRVTHHEYVIDDDLGRLTGNVGIKSYLFKVYLHALTSGSLPDPLTGHTGTEEALRELSNGRAYSFQRLGEEEFHLLDVIASLTPERSFYPGHLKVMQDVKWSTLPSLAQHPGYRRAAESITSFACSLAIFSESRSSREQDAESTKVFASASGGNDRLAIRASNRSVFFYSPDTLSSAAASRQDMSEQQVHASRRFSSQTSSSCQTQSTTDAVAKFCYQMQLSPDILAYCTDDIMKMLEVWGTIGFNNNIKLSYSRYWVQNPKFSHDWLALSQRCLEFQDRDGANRYELIFSLAGLVYTSPEQKKVALILLACALDRRLHSLEYSLRNPDGACLYELRDGYVPTMARVQSSVRSHAYGPHVSPASSIPCFSGETLRKFKDRKEKYHHDGINSAIDAFAPMLLEQWPGKPTVKTMSMHSSPIPIAQWIDIQAAVSSVDPYFRSCRINKWLQERIQHMQSVLRSSFRPPVSFSLFIEYNTGHRPIAPHARCIALAQLLGLRSPPHTISSHLRDVVQASLPNHTSSSLISSQTHSSDDLKTLIAELSDGKSSTLERSFGQSLENSRQHLTQLPQKQPPTATSLSDLKASRNRCRSALRLALEEVQNSLSPQAIHEHVLQSAGLWPRISHRTILELLGLTARNSVSQQWLFAIESLGLIFLQYQRSQRLLELYANDKVEEYAKELENVVSANPTDSHSSDFDWLLIQIESNMLVRPLQRSVAREMITPSSRESTLLQLNMGEGKSSVIVPCASASLADGTKLVRVVVLKALSSQMFDLLVARLTGLPNRRIFYMPFSRNIQISPQVVMQIRTMYEECMRVGGILIAQPEHILSFKLMGLDRLISQSSSNDHSLADTLWTCQQWVDTHSRDVLDESDELLHSRYQLVYTNGVQQALEDSPRRWTTVQQLLQVTKICIIDLLRKYPNDILYDPKSSNNFPYIRLLSANVDIALTESITACIMSGGLPNLNFSALPTSLQHCIREFIISETLTDSTKEAVEGACRESGFWPSILLLRGLLSYQSGVLLYILKERRWRVDFGLDPARTMLAVPYRAKDVPSARAEFGHPDVAITLTCLSYYYGGLTKAQVLLCFELLAKLDDPILEYGRWIAVGPDLVNGSIKHLSGVNIRDTELIDDILVPTFRLNHAVVDFFLQQVVFPREAKEFPSKISTSGWDLAMRKLNVTTGFSGTRDNRFLLPTSIEQGEPVTPQQRSTDALVLNYLLQPENSYHALSHQLSGTEYVDFICSQDSVHVILDVGAQILDLQNEDLARLWLDRSPPTIAAAVFFTESDDLVVLTRDGVTESLRSSSYNERLEECVVYLDDAHTRGTDLRLPRDARAALTLGPKVTKDRVVQGAMRMRKLGHGQSVLITAPPEIDRAIRSVAGLPAKRAVKVIDVIRSVVGLPAKRTVKVIDVIRWAVQETCADIHRHVPHWVDQGLDYETRRAAYETYRGSTNITHLKKGWLRAEAKSLEELYGCTESQREDAETRHAAFRDPELAARLGAIGAVRISVTKQSEEQEREVKHEVERERQIERPPAVTAVPHALHPDVKQFVISGRITRNSTQFKSLFYPAWRASAPSGLYSTLDFMSTVQGVALDSLHEYMRPVCWILSSTKSSSAPETLVVISPFEANALLPFVRQNRAGVRLHVYAPRLVQNMASFSDLRFISVPALPPLARWRAPALMRVQLGLWAGQLFFDNYKAYKILCRYLGLYMGCTETTIKQLQDNDLIRADGFVKPPGKNLAEMELSLQTSPVTVLKKLFTLRRKGLPYSSTHMGQILEARELRAEDFDN